MEGVTVCVGEPETVRVMLGVMDFDAVDVCELLRVDVRVPLALGVPFLRGSSAPSLCA